MKKLESNAHLLERQKQIRIPGKGGAFLQESIKFRRHYEQEVVLTPSKQGGDWEDRISKKDRWERRGPREKDWKTSLKPWRLKE